MIDATLNQRPFPVENVHIVFSSRTSTALFSIGLPAELLRTFSGSAGLLYAAFRALGIIHSIYARSVCGLPRSRAVEFTVKHADTSLRMPER